MERPACGPAASLQRSWELYLGLLRVKPSRLLAQQPCKGICESALQFSQESTKYTEHCKNACILALHFRINNYDFAVGRKTFSF